MGRCLSPCLGDLDPNLYRRRVDEALRLFADGGDGAQRLLAHVDAQMRQAAAQRRYERAAWLRRRAQRLRTILAGLGGVLEATHARPRLALGAHPTDPRRLDAFWVLGGRLLDWGAISDDLGDLDELEQRTEAAIRRGGRIGELGAHLPPGEVDEVRIVAGYLASHPATPQLVLAPAPSREALERFIAAHLG